MDKQQKINLAVYNYFIEIKGKQRLATMEEVKQHFRGEYSREEVEVAVNELLNSSNITSQTAYGIYEMSEDEFVELLENNDKE